KKPKKNRFNFTQIEEDGEIIPVMSVSLEDLLNEEQEAQVEQEQNEVVKKESEKKPEEDIKIEKPKLFPRFKVTPVESGSSDKNKNEQAHSDTTGDGSDITARSRGVNDDDAPQTIDEQNEEKGGDSSGKKKRRKKRKRGPPLPPIVKSIDEVQYMRNRMDVLDDAYKRTIEDAQEKSKKR
ncbi:MAG: hypothetical protein EZS28_010619, partial [Streblomastix strix]